MNIKFAFGVLTCAHVLHAMTFILVPTQAIISSSMRNKFFKELIVERTIEGDTQGALVALKQGISWGFDVHCKDDAKRTLLHVLATYDAVDLVTYLLTAGVDATSRDVNECTPLHCAVYSANAPRVIQELLKAGADVNAQDILGNTPLMYAVMSAKKSAIYALLAVPKIQCMARNAQGRTAYALAEIYHPEIAVLLHAYTTLKNLSLNYIVKHQDKFSQEQITGLPAELQEALQERQKFTIV